MLGNYIYLESSDPKTHNKSAILKSRPIKAAYSQCMRFYANMNGRDMGDLKVDVLADGETKTVYHKTGNQGPQWFEGLVQLPVDKEFQVCAIYYWQASF